MAKRRDWVFLPTFLAGEREGENILDRCCVEKLKTITIIDSKWFVIWYFNYMYLLYVYKII